MLICTHFDGGGGIWKSVCFDILCLASYSLCQLNKVIGSFENGWGIFFKLHHNTSNRFILFFIIINQIAWIYPLNIPVCIFSTPLQMVFEKTFWQSFWHCINLLKDIYISTLFYNSFFNQIQCSNLLEHNPEPHWHIFSTPWDGRIFNQVVYTIQTTMTRSMVQICQAWSLLKLNCVALSYLIVQMYGHSHLGKSYYEVTLPKHSAERHISSL